MLLEGLEVDNGGTIIEEYCCHECGYNLKGLKPGGCCPECGIRIEFVPPKRLEPPAFRDSRIVWLSFMLLLFVFGFAGFAMSQSPTIYFLLWVVWLTAVVPLYSLIGSRLHSLWIAWLFLGGLFSIFGLPFLVK